MEGKSVCKVTRHCNSAVCGADTPGPSPVTVGVRVAPHSVIKISNFCNKILWGFRSIVSQNPCFPIDCWFAGHRYNSSTACDA